MALIASAAVLLAFLLIARGEVDAGPYYEDAELDKPLYPSPIIDMVNQDPTAGWTAGVNEKFINYTLRQLRKMGGGLLPQDANLSVVEPSHLQKYHQYDQYDSRATYNCPSMWRVLDQGTCGSCWAFAPVLVLMDRYCIFYNMDVFLSVNDVLTCCPNCGDCDLGYLGRAWDYLANTGTVTWQCAPYFDTTACPSPGCTGVDTPACVKECEDNEVWNDVKYFAGPKYRLGSIADIQNEIIQNGPVTALMRIYEDFYYYKSGVYRHRNGNFIINHFIKLVGWGITSDGVRYWQATNQWGTNWGENGHFKIALGVDECRIESYVWAAKPVYKMYSES